MERVKASLMTALKRLPAGQMLGIPPRLEQTTMSHHHTTPDIIQMGMEIEVHPLQVRKMATHTHIASEEDVDFTCGTNGYSGHCHSLESHHNTQAPSSSEVNGGWPRGAVVSLLKVEAGYTVTMLWVRIPMPAPRCEGDKG